MTSEIITSRGAIVAFFATGVGSSRAARGGGRNKCNLRLKKFPPENPIMSPRGRGRADEGHFVPSNGSTERWRTMTGSLFNRPASTQSPHHWHCLHTRTHYTSGECD